MKKLILSLILMISVLSAKAQDESVFMHYTNSPTLINPAHAGFQEQFQALFNFRNQWTGFKGSPFTYSAGVETPIGKVMGAGFRLWSENIASLTSYKMQLDYAFRYEINKMKVAGGFSTAYKTVNLNPAEIDNTHLDPDDPIVQAYIDGVRVFDASFGLFAKYNDKTSIGFTFPSLVVNKLNSISTGDDDMNLFSFYTAYFAHELYIREYNVTIEPSLLLRKIRNGAHTLDVNFKGGFLNEKLVGGLSYRIPLEENLTFSDGAAGILLGTDFDNITIYYSYDISLLAFQGYNAGGHEISFRLKFSDPK
ncbi:MAG: PorP/SprF family type IX secretion system membrane protein [Saprospiraceae bacterium]|nr:PorP/SprF family type IX secretion system membrane protein [Saprospiraceae bacterium]